MNIVIYENNEIGFGYGLYVVNLEDFDDSNDDERVYKEAILEAIKKKDKYGYGSADSPFMLHRILENKNSKVKEVKLPLQIDHAIYIYAL